MRISLLCVCQALKLGLDTQLKDLDGVYRYGKLEPRWAITGVAVELARRFTRRCAVKWRSFSR